MVTADILGAVLALALRSPVHRPLPLGRLEELLVAPIALDRCAIVVENRSLCAVATWALLNDEAAARLPTTGIEARDFARRDGDVYCVDVIAPFGHARQAISSLRAVLRHRGYADRRMHFMRRYASGAIRLSSVRI